MSSYTPLHVHSIYSNLDGLSKVEEIVDRCIEIGAHGVCISDHAFATSHYELAELCNKKNIKPIFAVEGYLSPRSNTLHEKIEGFKDYYHITMIAQTATGYKNLMSLIADAFMNGRYRKPRTDLSALERWSEGVIVLQSCLGGVVSQMLAADRDEEAEQWASNFKEIFGDRYFLELTYTKLEEQDYVNKKTIALAEKLGIEVVITPDSHYTRAEDSDYHKAMVCINVNRPFVPTGKEKDGDDVDEGSMFYTPGEYFLKSREDLEVYYSQFANSERYFENTNSIADSVEWIKLDKEKKFPCDYSDPDQELMSRIITGLNNKIASGTLSPEHRDQYTARLKEELDTIIKMGFSDYFIEIQNIILWANEQGITTGPGRGCFHEGTSIKLYDGRRIPISEVQPGMSVRSSDRSKQEVIAVYRYDVNDILCCVSYKFGNLLHRVFATSDHKFLVIDKVSVTSVDDWNELVALHYFVPISELKKSQHMLVAGDDHDYYYLPLMDVYSVQSGEYAVYDLSVTGNNTFEAGDSFVHNSGAGSFINFVLDITRVNPLEYGLLFTRMLNSGRASFPKIEDILNGKAE